MRDVSAVFVVAGRLLLRHWPAMLALGFLGAALRQAAVYGAIQLSDVQAQLGQLLLVLAPLGYLLPIIVMLRVCRRSLPALGEVEQLEPVAPVERRELRLVDVAVSVLVPFLAVYTAYGLLDADIFRYRNIAAADVVFNEVDEGAGATARRLGIYSLQIALLIVLGAWLLRWVTGRLERKLRLVWLAYLGALLELVYVVQLASQIVVIKVRGVAWIEDRVAYHWVQGWYDAVVDFLGPVAGAFEVSAQLVEDAVGSLDTVVIVPVAWLTVAAVVLGYQLAEQEDEERPRRGGLLSSLMADVKERFSPLVGGLRLLASAGLAPMLLFSVGFVVVTSLPALVHVASRAVIGPQTHNTWLAIGPFELALGYAVSLALSAPMLAAAVDWLVRRRRASRSPVAGPRTPATV